MHGKCFIIQAITVRTSLSVASLDSASSGIPIRMLFTMAALFQNGGRAAEGTVYGKERNQP